MMGNIKGYFNPYPEKLGSTITCGLSGAGKTIRAIRAIRAIRVFTCTTDTTDISRLTSQSISALAKIIQKNCQVKINVKS